MPYDDPRRRANSSHSYSFLHSSPPATPSYVGPPTSPFAVAIHHMPLAQQSQVIAPAASGFGLESRLRRSSNGSARSRTASPPPTPLSARSSDIPPVPPIPREHRQRPPPRYREPPPAYTRDPVSSPGCPCPLPRSGSDLYGGMSDASVIDYGSPSPSYRTSPSTASSTSSSPVQDSSVSRSPAGRTGLGKKLLKPFVGSLGRRPSQPSTVPFPVTSPETEADMLITSSRSRTPSISSTTDSIAGVPYSRARLPSFAETGSRTSSFCGSSLSTPSSASTSTRDPRIPTPFPAARDRSRRSSGATINDHRRSGSDYDSDQSCAAIMRATKVSYTSSTAPSIASRDAQGRERSSSLRRPSVDEARRFFALGEQQTLKEREEAKKKAEKQGARAGGGGWLGGAVRKRANSLGRTREYWAN